MTRRSPPQTSGTDCRGARAASRTALWIASAAWWLTGTVALAKCLEPESTISIPKGRTATREEMVEAAKRIQDYDAAVKKYVACLERGGAKKGSEDEALRKLQVMADQFNLELRDFKARADK